MIRVCAVVLALAALFAPRGDVAARERVEVADSAGKVAVSTRRPVLAGKPTQIAQNTPTAKCEIIEFLAETTDRPSVDPKLDALKAAFKKPPLSAWNTFTFTGSQSVTAPQSKAVTAKITSTVGLLLKGVAQGQGKKPRLSLHIDIDDAGGSRFYSTNVDVDSGHTDIYSAGPYKKGNLFVALTCKL